MSTETESVVESRFGDMVVEKDDEFRVRTQLYTDPQLFDEEMRRIFGRTWVYVAHESQVASAGDYLTTSIGAQPVIVSRGEDGRIHVLLNMCRHRGSVVCRDDSGNAQFFRCPYHGWVYRNDGTLATITEGTAYPDAFGASVGGLVPVPRVAVYRGLVFASLSPEGPSIEEHLGEAKEYVDLWVERSPTGEVRVRRPHKFLYRGNWKYQAENGADGYHGRFVHASAFSTEDHFKTRPARPNPTRAVHGVGGTRGFDGGHGLLERPGTRGELPSGLHEPYIASLVGQYGQERTERITMVRHIFVFPNIYLMDDNIRVIRPIAVDLCEVDSYCASLGGVSDEINRFRLKNLQWRLGTAGFIAPDDMEMFVRCQSGMQASAAEWIYLSRGMGREETRATGERLGESSDETPQRAIYREWARLMAGAEERANGWA